MTVKPLESDAERIYASIRVALERKGTPIGAHDMLIAQSPTVDVIEVNAAGQRR